MVTLQLQKVVYKKINSFFDIQEKMELIISNEFSLNVNYSEDNKSCFATLINETKVPDNPNVVEISVEIVGIFSCEGIKTSEDKKDAHLQIYNFLFPYVQSLVADLFGKAGLPPLMLERTDIDISSVNVDE